MFIFYCLSSYPLFTALYYPYFHQNLTSVRMSQESEQFLEHSRHKTNIYGIKEYVYTYI